MMDAKREYVANKVLSASPIELVRILYEVALDSVNKAIFYLHSGDIMARGRAITTATEAVIELSVSLRPVDGNDYSQNLAALYAYIQRQLFKAHVEKSEAMLAEVARLLGVLLEGWASVTRLPEENTVRMELVAPGAGIPAQPAAPYMDNSFATVASSRSWQF